MEILVLAGDWDGGVDPVPYYGTDSDLCLDFNSSLAKPRAVLTEVDRKPMTDCEHGVAYNVVVCKV